MENGGKRTVVIRRGREISSIVEENGDYQLVIDPTADLLPKSNGPEHRAGLSRVDRLWLVELADPAEGIAVRIPEGIHEELALGIGMLEAIDAEVVFVAIVGELIKSS